MMVELAHFMLRCRNAIALGDSAYVFIAARYEKASHTLRQDGGDSWASVLGAPIATSHAFFHLYWPQQHQPKSTTV